MTIKDQYAVSVFSLPPPPFLSIKPLAPLVSVREELAFGQMSATPLPWLQASEIKQLSFPSVWPVYWLLSNEQPDPTAPVLPTNIQS